MHGYTRRRTAFDLAWAVIRAADIPVTSQVDAVIMDAKHWLGDASSRAVLAQRFTHAQLAWYGWSWTALPGDSAIFHVRVALDGSESDVDSGLEALAQGSRFASPCLGELSSGEVSLVSENGWNLPAERAEQTLACVTREVELTPRERDILRRVVLGAKSEAIAIDLGISVATVRHHRENLRAKLKVHNTAQLTAFAMTLGLLAGPND